MKTKSVIITGVSSGIGKASAELFLQSGWQVYGLSRSRVSMDGLHWFSCDVTDPDAVHSAFSSILSEITPDLLLVNAGNGISGAMEFISSEDCALQLNTNLLGAVLSSREVLSSMRKSQSGKILFISSLAAVFPIPFQSLYSASKAGLSCFSDALRLEVSPFHIQVATLLLGDVKTGFTATRKKNEEGNELYQDRIRSSVQKMEHDELHGISPEKVAKKILSLANRNRLSPHNTIGFQSRLLLFLSRILPTSLVLKIVSIIYR